MGTARILVIAAIAAAAIVTIVRFEVLCLRDLADTPDADLRYLTRTGWLTAIVLAIPIGGIAYLYNGRTH